MENIQIDNNDLTCYICLDTLNISLNQLLLCGCPNRYHKNCLHEWIKKTSICPICKKNIYYYYYENKTNENMEDILDILSTIPIITNINNDENFNIITQQQLNLQVQIYVNPHIFISNQLQLLSIIIIYGIIMIIYFIINIFYMV